MCIIVIGRLGKDAEVNQTASGTKFVRFTVAENKYKNGEDKTIWYDVVSYDSFVINTQIKVLKKGTFVVIVGALDSKINIGKTGNVYLNHNITAWNINVPNLGGKDNARTEMPESAPVEAPIAQPTISLSKLSKPEEKQVLNEAPSQVTSGTLNDDDGGDDLPF